MPTPRTPLLFLTSAQLKNRPFSNRDDEETGHILICGYGLPILTFLVPILNFFTEAEGHPRNQQTDILYNPLVHELQSTSLIHRSFPREHRRNNRLPLEHIAT